MAVYSCNRAALLFNFQKDDKVISQFFIARLQNSFSICDNENLKSVSATSHL